MEPKLPHISELRALIANAVAPMPTQSEAYKAGLRWVRGQSPREGDEFGVEVMRSLGDRKVLGGMQEVDLQKEFGFAYRQQAQDERKVRTASVDTMLGEATRVALGGGE